MILQGLTGTGSGKMGSAVFVVNSGTQIVRQHQPVIYNPNTSAQVSQRAKLKLIQQIGTAFDSVIAMPKKGLKRSRNYFASRNIDIVHAYSDHVEIEYEKIQLTAGSIAFPAVHVENVGASSINIFLDYAPGASVSRVVYNVFKKSTEDEFYLVRSQIVTDKGVDGTYPINIPYLPTDVVVYAYGIKDRDATATARYTSYRVKDGEDIATLITSRMMSNTEFRLTRTTASTLYYDYLDLPYGVEFDTENPSPTLRRLGNSRLHAALPVQSQMRGCLLTDDGVVGRYLNPDDWRDETLDGSEGQVMVELPAYWRKFVTDGTKRQAWISAVYQDGFEYVPKMYVSAFEASIDREQNKLASVYNTTVRYRGGNNNSEYDFLPNSLLGMPATNISRTSLRTFARARKEGSTEWNIYTYDVHKTLFWFFAIEYATLNSQAGFISQLSPDGFRQGGLGVGVCSLSNSWWSSYNGLNPIIPCNIALRLGNNTGIVSYEIPPLVHGDTPISVSVPSYRGIRNPFGHIAKWIDGINVYVYPNQEHGGSGISEVYTTNEPSLYKDNDNDGYSLIGLEQRDTSKIKEIVFGNKGEIVPSLGGATIDTYFCDSHNTNVANEQLSIRGITIGGLADSSYDAGLASYRSSLAANQVSHNLGTRLCFIPNTES